jgi:hypothetical protein
MDHSLLDCVSASSNCCDVSLSPLTPSLARSLSRIFAAASLPAICVDDRGHPVWSLTFMVQGKKKVQHIPKDWVEEVRRRVKEGREFQDAVREVLAANAQLLVLERKKPKKK